MFDLSGKSAFVTGGASGIGEAIASAFKAQGADVYIGDLDGRAATAAAEKIGCEGFALDVRRADDLRAAAARLIDHAGKLDILVNSAGVMHVGALHETDTEDFDRIQEVNVRGCFLACRAVIGHMLKRRAGNIINLASVASLIGVERRFAYCVSKGAVLEMTRALAIDYAQSGIRANAICPGTVDTPMIRNYVQANFADDVEATWARLHERQPIGRMGEPREIAALAVFLASDDSAYMTGAALPIDGGWTAR